MKTIGLLGGMSWESTVPYYQGINRVVAAHLGGLHSAKILLYSFDFAEIEQLQREDRWADAADRLGSAATRLERAGAELLVLCTNTMHEVGAQVEAAIGVPFLHVADAVAAAAQHAGLRRLGLLGTRFTMERTFYRDRLAVRGLDTIVPAQPDRERIHQVIYDELCRGVIRDPSRDRLREIIVRLTDEGAEGVILGCTELGLLLSQQDAAVPVFDSTDLHARHAAEVALGIAR